MTHTIIDLLSFLLSVTIDVIIKIATIWLICFQYALYLLHIIYSIIFSYIFVTIILLLTVGSLIFLSDLMLKTRHNRFITDIIPLKRNKRSAKTNMFLDNYNEQMISYSKFIKKHITNDLFSNIFISYYQDGIMTKDRISAVIKKYIFDIDKDDNIPLSMTTIHRLTNQLTIKFIKTYVSDFINVSENYIIDSDSTNNTNKVWNDWTDWIKHTDVVLQKSMLSIIMNHIKYIKFYIILRSRGYICKDLNSDIRIWVKKNILYDSDQTNKTNKTNKSNNISILVLDMITSHVFSDMNNDLLDASILVEIKGFTNYSEIFDIITMDRYNRYLNASEIAEQFGSVIDFVLSYNNKSININTTNTNTINTNTINTNTINTKSIIIILYGSTTILAPFISNRYWELYNDLILIDPICYPYSYHTFYVNINRSNTSHMNYNYIKIFDKMTLLDLYLETHLMEAKVCGLYSKNVHIAFSDNHCLYTNKDLLQLLFTMHSRIDIIDNVDDIMLFINNNKYEHSNRNMRDMIDTITVVDTNNSIGTVDSIADIDDTDIDNIYINNTNITTIINNK